MPLGVVTPQAAIGRVRLTFAGHRAFFAPRMTMGKVARCPRSLDFMQTAMNENVNVKISTCIMSATTRLVWHVHAGPGARAARPHTSSAPPRHHEKLLIPATGIVPSGTREYEDTFPCRVLLFPCTSLKNHIPVLHTGIDISLRLVTREF